MNSLTEAFAEYIAPTPFEHPKLRDWFFQNVDASGLFPLGVATLGSGPFNEDDFDIFLGRLGIEVYATLPYLNVLVVGQQDWEEDQLNDAINARRGKELRVYSQEMFLALLRTGKDPLDSPVIAIHFGKGHPALEYIKEWGFDWPNARIVPVSSGVIATPRLRENSPLTIFGYKAGKTGKSKEERLNSLTRVFYADFNANPRLAEFLPDWGGPKSGTRLEKIAERVAMNIDPLSAGGRRPEAVKDWLEDLEWLRTTFYDGKHTFGWPSPNVY